MSAFMKVSNKGSDSFMKQYQKRIIKLSILADEESLNLPWLAILLLLLIAKSVFCHWIKGGRQKMTFYGRRPFEIFPKIPFP